MSTVATRVPLAEAERKANALMELLRPACIRIAIAGSIRRRKPDVGDIELLMVPKFEQYQTFDMFGELASAETVNRLDHYCDVLHDQDILRARLGKDGKAAWGSKYKRARFDGMAADLFSVLHPAQFGVLLAIRTGPATWSHRLVMRDYAGGMLPAGHVIRDGALWRGAEMLDTPDEETLFRQLGREYVPPEERV